MRPIIPALAWAIALAGCGDGGARENGGLTAAEQEELREAADIVEQHRLPDDAMPPPLPTEAGADDDSGASVTPAQEAAETPAATSDGDSGSTQAE